MRKITGYEIVDKQEFKSISILSDTQRKKAYSIVERKNKICGTSRFAVITKIEEENV